MSTILVRRAYEAPTPRDGARVLVDRLWPRGVSKRTAHLDAWAKELGPSNTLRQWFDHRPERWTAFVTKYRLELATPLRQMLLSALQHAAAQEHTLTLVYAARDVQNNEAVVLADYLGAHTAPISSHLENETTALIAVTIVAAGSPVRSAKRSALALFTPADMQYDDVDDALSTLVDQGELQKSTAGWAVTARGRHKLSALSATANDR